MFRDLNGQNIPSYALALNRAHVVDANFFLLDLGQYCTYKTINTFGQGQEPHAPPMNKGGGALAEEPPMPKVEFREKECLENFWIFARVFELKFCENGSIYIGIGRPSLEKEWPAIWLILG